MNARIDFLADCPWHAATLAQWHHDEWGALMPDWSRDEAERELIDHALRRVLPTTRVATDGDHLLGSVSLIEEDARQFRDLGPWLASLFVTPSARGHGVGTALVRDAVRLADRCGVRTLYLFTADEAAFYQRMGWHAVERRDLHGRAVDILAIAPAAMLTH